MKISINTSIIILIGSVLYSSSSSSSSSLETPNKSINQQQQQKSIERKQRRSNHNVCKSSKHNKKQPEHNNNNNNNNKKKKVSSESNLRKRVSGYYPVYNSKFQLPSQINYTLYTDLIFFTTVTQPNFTIGIGDVKQTLWDKLSYDFVKRCKAANVKPRFAVGGWTGSLYFSDLVANEESRKKYARELKSFGIKYGFEGIDLDWEYPTLDGIGCNKKRPEDLKNFGLLTRELKSIWPESELSAAVAVSGIKDGTSLATKDLELLNKNLDFINIMAYDVYGGWSTKTGPNAPIRSSCSTQTAESGASVEDSIKIFKSQGFKDQQIVMGIPGYGRAFGLKHDSTSDKVISNSTSSLYQDHSSVTPSGGPSDDKPGLDACGVKTGYSGVWRFQELISFGYLSKDGKKAQGGGFTKHFDDCSGTPYLINSTTLITYDDHQSMITKAKYSKSQNLAGVFFFDTQGPTDDLIQSTKQALN